MEDYAKAKTFGELERDLRYPMLVMVTRARPGNSVEPESEGVDRRVIEGF